MGIRSRLGDLLLAPALERTIRAEVDRALTGAYDRIADLEQRLAAAESEAGAARQEARTALATAESAADGVSALEVAKEGAAPKAPRKPRKKADAAPS